MFAWTETPQIKSPDASNNSGNCSTYYNSQQCHSGNQTGFPWTPSNSEHTPSNLSPCQSGISLPSPVTMMEDMNFQHISLTSRDDTECTCGAHGTCTEWLNYSSYELSMKDKFSREFDSTENVTNITATNKTDIIRWMLPTESQNQKPFEETNKPRHSHCLQVHEHQTNSAKDADNPQGTLNQAKLGKHARKKPSKKRASPTSASSATEEGHALQSCSAIPVQDRAVLSELEGYMDSDVTRIDNTMATCVKQEIKFSEEDFVGMIDLTAGEPVSCQVCGDVSSGFHCGAYVCEACKKFFVRCAKTGDVKFSCSRDGRCEITKDTRTHCQYCRYQKCIVLGMYKPGGQNVSHVINHLPCSVCNGPSSGFHFGAITCEGCKGFFRRMSKEKDSSRFICRQNGNCDVKNKSRITCRGCRYRKCLEAGLNLAGSRIGRQSNLVKHNTLRQIQEIKEIKGEDVPDLFNTPAVKTSLSKHSPRKCNTASSKKASSLLCKSQASKDDAYINGEVKSEEKYLVRNTEQHAKHQSPPSHLRTMLITPLEKTGISANNSSEHGGCLSNAPPYTPFDLHHSRLMMPHRSSHGKRYPWEGSTTPDMSDSKFPQWVPRLPCNLPTYPPDVYPYPPPCTASAPSVSHTIAPLKLLPATSQRSQSVSSKRPCSESHVDELLHSPESKKSFASLRSSQRKFNPGERCLLFAPGIITTIQTGHNDIKEKINGAELAELMKTLSPNDFAPAQVVEIMKFAAEDLYPIYHRSPQFLLINDNTTPLESWESQMQQFKTCAYAAIRFAKKVPGFRKMLPETQVQRLQASLYPIVLSCLSMDYDLTQSSYNYFNFFPAEEDLIMKTFPAFRSLRDTLHNTGFSLKNINASLVEVTFLCALLLAQEVPLMENVLLDGLELHCRETSMYPIHRYGELLLRLSELIRAGCVHQKSVVTMSVYLITEGFEIPQLFQESFLND